MLRRFARKYGTRDIVEEYRSIPVCPLVDGWSVAEDEWAEDIGGIPCPDWTKVFGFTADCKLLCVLQRVVLCHVLSKRNADELGCFPAVLRRRKVEAHGDFILGPVSPKEYKDTVAELNGSRTNRIFEFFKIAPPKRRFCQTPRGSREEGRGGRSRRSGRGGDGDFAARCSAENRPEERACCGHCCR
jgi:hypothetical protein